MRRDDVIRMAREAGLASICSACDEPDVYAYEDWDEELFKFAILVRADEREACAKVCDEMPLRKFPARPSDCAAAIRARSNPCFVEKEEE